MSVGSKIKCLRKEKGLTQAELCGNYINRVILSRIENDKMFPSLEQLYYIADCLDTNVNYLIEDVSTDYNDYIEKPVIINTKLSEMYKKGEYNRIVKYKEDCGKGVDYEESFYIGMSYFNLKIPYEAIRPLKRFVNLYTKSEQILQQKYVINFITALNTLFKIMMINKNYEKGESYLKMAIKNINKYSLDNSYLSFSIHNNLAYTYFQQCKYNEIVLFLEPFVQSHKTIICPEITASMCLSLNIAYYNMDRYGDSVRYIEKAISLYEFLESEIDAANCYFNYLNALRYSLDYDKAIRIVNECLDRYMGYVDVYEKFLLQKMIILFNMNDYKNVADIIEIIKTQKIDRKNLYDYYFMFGHIEHVYLKDDNKAYDHLVRVINYYRKNNYSKDLCSVFNDLFEMTKDESYKDQIYEVMKSTNKKKNVII